MTIKLFCHSKKCDYLFLQEIIQLFKLVQPLEIRIKTALCMIELKFSKFYLFMIGYVYSLGNVNFKDI